MKLKVGDIFSLPITEDKVGYGQIILKPKYKLFIIVFEELHESNASPKIEQIPKKSPLLMGYTLDGLLYNGDWKVIGNYQANINNYPLPFYKEGFPPEVFLVDYKGDRIRPATPIEAQILGYRGELSPIYYEEALKAWHGNLPWEKSFDEILYKNVLKQIVSVTPDWNK